MRARNQCTKLAQLKVLIRVSSSIKYTAWLELVGIAVGGHECEFFGRHCLLPLYLEVK